MEFWTKAFDDPTAAATCLLAIFTFILIIVGSRQARQLKRSVDAMRNDFNATHRPQVLVHRFLYHVDANENIAVKFTLVNSGNTNANDLSVDYQFYIARNIYDVDESSFKVLQLEAPILRPGERVSISIGIAVDDEGRDVLADYMARHGQGVRLGMVGYISYADELGNYRETGFHRIFDHTNNTWQKAQNSEYDYSY